MGEYYKILKQSGIKLEKIGEPKKNFAGNWSIHVTYWFECPYCNKKDNSLQNSDWAIQGENYSPARTSPSKQCFNCKKEYKPILVAKCDFSELKKSEANSKKNSANEPLKSISASVEDDVDIDQDEEYTEDNFSNSDDGDLPQKKTIPGGGVIVATVVFYFISIILLHSEEARKQGLFLLGITIILLLLSIYKSKITFKEENTPFTFKSVALFTLFQFWGYLSNYSDSTNNKKDNGLIKNFLIKVGKKIYIREIL